MLYLRLLLCTEGMVKMREGVQSPSLGWCVHVMLSDPTDAWAVPEQEDGWLSPKHDGTTVKKRYKEVINTTPAIIATKLSYR